MTWVKARSERRKEDEEGLVTKTVTVEENPFGKLVIQPWMEEASLEAASPPGGEEDIIIIIIMLVINIFIVMTLNLSYLLHKPDSLTSNIYTFVST